MKRVFQTIFFSIFLTSSAYGIKAINVLEIGEKSNDIYGSFELSFNSSKGNSEREKYSMSTSFQRFYSTNIWFLSANYTFQQSKLEYENYVKTDNKSYLHIRNIREISKITNWEYFGQIEHNEFQKLAFRGLLGGGLRFKPFLDHKIYCGIGSIALREIYLDLESESDTIFRINLYLNMKYNLTEKTDLSYVVYYQPEIVEFSNFDIIQSLKLENRITENFSFVIKVSYDYDSTPIDSIGKYDFEQTTALKYKF